jgi:hypothetical protein
MSTNTTEASGDPHPFLSYLAADDGLLMVFFRPGARRRCWPYAVTNLIFSISTTMEKLKMLSKRILFSLALVLLLSLTAFSVGAKSTDSTPNAQVTINVTQAAMGLGVSWGNGTLNFKGKNYKFKLKGLNMIGLGVTSINAQGDVYNLQKLSDFPGTYYGVEAGATVIKGSAGLVLKNSNGVVLNLKSERTGAELSLGNEGLSISPAWE